MIDSIKVLNGLEVATPIESSHGIKLTVEHAKTQTTPSLIHCYNGIPVIGTWVIPRGGEEGSGAEEGCMNYKLKINQEIEEKRKDV